MPGAFTQYLTDDGTPTGTVNANLNFAVAADWYIQDATEELHLGSMTAQYADAGGMRVATLGNNVNPANGLTIELRDAGGGTRTDLTGGDPIVRHADWSTVAADLVPGAAAAQYGAGSNFVIHTLDFHRLLGGPLIVPVGWTFGVRFGIADYTGLQTQRFLVRGFKV